MASSNKDNKNNEDVSNTNGAEGYEEILNGKSVADKNILAVIEDVKKSGLRPETLIKAGIKVFNDKPETLAERLNFDPALVKKLLEKHTFIEFPYFPYDSGLNSPARFKIIPAWQLSNEKILKYIQPRGSEVMPYILGHVWNSRDSQEPIWFTEGEKKALALLQEDILGIGVPGVWAFRADKAKSNGKICLSEILHKFNWENREVYIAYDADFKGNENVRKALFELACLLKNEGANVNIVIWDEKIGKGIDDYLVNSEKNNQEIIQELIRNAKTIEQIGKNFPEELLRGLAVISNTNIELEEHATKLTEEFKVTKTTLMKDLTNSKKKLQKQKEYTPTISNEIDYGISDDNKLIRYGKNGAEVIADCNVMITKIQRIESGEEFYFISGVNSKGHPINFRISSTDFADSKKLKATLESAMGPFCSVSANLSAHIGPAIKRLQGSEKIIPELLFTRTGWTKIGKASKFLIPGNEPKGVIVELNNRKHCYELDENVDLEKGIEALDALLVAHSPSVTCAAFTFIMQGPLGMLVGWREERYCFFLKGLTGSLKTAFAQVLMCIWGKGFSKDSNIIKWGEGSTSNGIMGLATVPCDLPLLIDNYKYNTGKGPRAFIGLIHNILEGGEKDRLDKNAELRVSKKIETLPFCTGEDLPDSDSSTIARLLYTEVSWREGIVNESLQKAQDMSDHLNAVGRIWIQVLEGWANSSNSKSKIRDLFMKTRRKWAEILNREYSAMLNKTRVATNLASNELTWHLLSSIPAFKPVLEQHQEAYQEGLRHIASVVEASTSQANEAEQFLATLRELIQSGRLDIRKQRNFAAGESQDFAWHGWWEGQDLCIFPIPIFKAIREHLGTSQQISKTTLYQQLFAMGAIVDRSGKDFTKTFAISNAKVKSARALYLKSEFVRDVDLDEEEKDPFDLL